MAKPCAVSGCPQSARSLGLCVRHYSRQYRGRPLEDFPGCSGPPEVRFWRFVDKGGECWLWTGSIQRGGYGMFLERPGKSVVAHRFAYRLLVGPVPEGLQLDHLCRVRNCVRPDHLEPVTARENTMRGLGFASANARKTHCKRGHEFTPENTRILTSGSRLCRACRRLREGRAA